MKRPKKKPIRANWGAILMKSTVHTTRWMLRPWVLSILAAAAVTGQAAAAPASTGADTLAEIIVTAEYRETKLQDTPIAITALTSEMIEQQGATKLSDILTSAPSVAFRQQSAAFGESVTAFIRGFGQADFDFLGVVPAHITQSARIKLHRLQAFNVAFLDRAEDRVRIKNAASHHLAVRA